ncbi:hypothetical protein ASPWEDRAFT_59712 [Aspergillus wentii DTO 134E9]|uniref:Enoyl reductase (ER) domain-containing protein n=1 Tax=Aspergillus wentii DTO 134E9 TaxID=1073089 RepID=A0A1L9RKD0_ASPWE|nr:uncharacterized protein ASPWEDRAFT_59712 [Aspergillus wentii DTO 134E9]OJJ35390.1 hypothetical protein ASPWEDRAFT_59712 [Aspergillus wentii DTO 134E9]
MIQTRKAIKETAPGKAELQDNVPLPRVRDDYIIAETKAFALNAADYHHIDLLDTAGPVIGCDWSGVVKDVGKDVTRFKPGDEVYGVCHGGNALEPEDGAFAEIITSKEHTTMHKPNHLSFEEAASLGAGLITVVQVLYSVMKLPLPSLHGTSGPTVLVYGGSSATGTIAIQAAKLSGCRVYATCSTNNLDLVKSRGADAVFDYTKPGCITQLLQADASITHIIDCIGDENAVHFCSKALSPSGGHYHSVKAPFPETFKALRPEDGVIGTTAVAYAMLGETFKFVDGTIFPADEELGEFAKKGMLILEDLVMDGKIQTHPVDVREGGLEGILDGLDELKNVGVRGKKIVYRV